MVLNDKNGEPDDLLEINDLQISIGQVDIMQGVSFSVRAKEIVGIVGESGSGKSMTCRAILGLLPRGTGVSGRIDFRGNNLLTLSEAEMRKVRGRQVAMIFQNPASHLDPLMTVGHHVMEPLRLQLGYKIGKAQQTALQLLTDVQIRDAEQRMASYPHQLSGGMKQRVMIASAFACSPRLLIADEPTTALDVTVQAEILKLLKSLNAEHGHSVILVSHDLGVIGEICDRVVVMKSGRVVEVGTTRDVLECPQHAYTKHLIDSQPGGRRSHAPGAHASRQPVDTASLIEISDLSVRFESSSFNPLGRLLHGKHQDDSVRAVDRVSLNVEQGEILGIVGESGSGKSTIAKTATKLVEPSGGDIRYRGESILGLKGAALMRYRRAVQMVFQNPFDSLNPRMTVGQTIIEPLVRHGIVERRQAGKRMHDLLEQVNLQPEMAHRRPRQLSGGQCQRVGIARALALEPEVLIADEITSALDVTIQAQILALLKDLQEQQNLTIVYISHDLSVVHDFCDRVAVFRLGHLVEVGDTDDIMYRPTQEYTRTLIAAIPKMRGASGGQITDINS